MLKKKIGALLAGAMILSLWGSATFASVINVGGVQWDPDSMFDLNIQSLNLRENTVKTVGDTLKGYGRVGSLNSKDNSVFCQSCDLTFTFSYTLQSVGTDQVVFKNGVVDFYVGASGSFDPADPSTAGNGTLWLSLSGHEAAYADFADVGELYGTINQGSVEFPGSQSSAFGLLDVVGGLAADWFDTNSEADGADFSLSSHYSYDPVCDVDSEGEGICGYPISGNATLLGASVSVPGPSALGLMGFGLLLLGFEVRRRRNNA